MRVLVYSLLNQERGSHSSSAALNRAVSPYDLHWAIFHPQTRRRVLPGTQQISRSRWSGAPRDQRDDRVAAVNELLRDNRNLLAVIRHGSKEVLKDVVRAVRGAVAGESFWLVEFDV